MLKPLTFDLQISGMTCASCAGRVERALNKLPDVKTVSVNLANERAHIETLGPIDTSVLIAAVDNAGYTASEVDDNPQSSESQQQTQHSRLNKERWSLLLAILLALPLVLPMLIEPFGIHWMLPAWVQFALATPVQFIFGARFYVAAWKAVRAALSRE